MSFWAGVDERLMYWQYDDISGAQTASEYYLTNHQGSVVATASSTTGQRVKAYTYDAYGNIGTEQGASQPFRYTGRRYDAETGLYYYRARYYSATLGRFMQTDPIGYEDNMNLYGYTNNDPVNNTDPTGESCENALQSTDIDPVTIVCGIAQFAFNEFVDPTEDINDTVTAFQEGDVVGVAVAVASVVNKPTKIFRKVDKFTKTSRIRKAKGRDGATSRHEVEKVNGETNSTTHVVEKDGKVVHQHQDHIGKHGSRRRFSDELTGTESINPSPEKKRLPEINCVGDDCKK